MVKYVEMDVPGIPGRQRGIILDLDEDKTVEKSSVYVDSGRGIKVKARLAVRRIIYFPDIKKPDGEPVIMLDSSNIVSAEKLDKDDGEHPSILKP